MDVLFFTTDLMASSKLEPAAKSLGLSSQTLGGLSQLEAAAPQSKLVVLDLNSITEGLRELIARLKAAAPNARIIAFGPHVHEAKLQAAQEAGCDAVFTRGQFHAQTAELLRRYVG